MALDLTWTRGQTEEWTLAILGEGDVGEDLSTAFALEFEVKTAIGSADPPLLILSIEPGGGIVLRAQTGDDVGYSDLTATDEQTFGLPTGFLRYDVWLTRADGTRKQAQSGELVILDPVNFPPGADGDPDPTVLFGTVVHDATLAGNGTASTPLGLSAAELAVIAAKLTAVAHDATLTGDGTAGDPLEVAATIIAGAAAGATALQTVVHDATLAGTGTIGSPLATVDTVHAQRFVYVATGAEGSDFRVNLPAARADALYQVIGELQDQVSGLWYSVRCPTSTAGDRLAASFRVVTGYDVAAGDKLAFWVADPT